MTAILASTAMDRFMAKVSIVPITGCWTDEDLKASVMVSLFDYFDTEARVVSVEVVGDDKDDGL